MCGVAHPRSPSHAALHRLRWRALFRVKRICLAITVHNMRCQLIFDAFFGMELKEHIVTPMKLGKRIVP